MWTSILLIPFDGVTDPIRDQSFVDTVSEFRAEFVGEDITTDEETDILTEAMGGPVESEDSEDSGQQTLNGETADTAGDSDTVALDPDGDPETPTEAWVLEALSEQDGEMFPTTNGIMHYLGIVEAGEATVGVETADTVLDPDHELWHNRPDLTDDRVITEQDTKRELDQALDGLREKGLVVLDDGQGPPAMEVLRVAA